MMTDASEQTETDGTLLQAKKPKLYLIDVENLVDGFIFSRSIVRLQEIIQNSIPAEPGDVVIVGTAILGIPRTVTAVWPQAQCLLRKGKDGADHALLRELCLRDLSNFSEVVIASGDHIFAEEAARLQLEGLSVTVLAKRGSISRLLRESGARILIVEDYCPEPDGSFVMPYIPDRRTASKRSQRRSRKQYEKKRDNINKRSRGKLYPEQYREDYSDEEQLE